MVSSSALVAAVAAAAMPLVAAQSYTNGAISINACRAALAAINPNIVINVINGTAGVTGTTNLNSGHPSVLTSGTCSGFSLNGNAKHVSARPRRRARRLGGGRAGQPATALGAPCRALPGLAGP